MFVFCFLINIIIIIIEKTKLTFQYCYEIIITIYNNKIIIDLSETKLLITREHNIVQRSAVIVFHNISFLILYKIPTFSLRLVQLGKRLKRVWVGSFICTYIYICM